MRIVGGELKGRRLQAPVDGRVRPTSDRVREALFNVLAHNDFGEPVGIFMFKGARVLDLFAGTGALGLEAISRGASFALFVDDDATSRGLIRTNAETLGVTGRTKIYRRDATRLGPRNASAGPVFDLVFADPPYGKGLGTKAMAELLRGDWLAPQGIVVLEEDKSIELPVPSGFVELDRRTYATTQVLLMSLEIDRETDNAVDLDPTHR